VAKIDHVMVISHTHWDPEWYSTFEEYRMRLVDLMDKLLDILENDPNYHSFMFDGQVSPLELYLELFPENRERIKSLVRTGKLLVGPWFVLPDEYMVSSEAHIRNLLLGTKIAQDYGEVMKVGYLPDMAGHISQMPQILKGFGIDSAVVWRGVAGYPETAETEFLWRGPDGTEVLAIHLPWGYCTGTALFDQTESTYKKIQALKKMYEARNATRFMLLMNGCDHEEPHPSLPKIIEEINNMNPCFRIEHTNILEYINAVKNELKNPDIHMGEMRRTETSFLMPGIQSTRIPLKQENVKTEVLLEKWVEPICTNAWLVGNKYPQRLIWTAWRYDLQNNFHDDIYGAHVDEVTPDVLNRYKRAQEISNRLIAISSYYIANHINTSGWYKALVVFNPTSWDRSEVVNATIDFPQKDNVEAFRITYKGKGVPFQILECQDFIKYQSERNIMDGMLPWLNDIPSFGTGPVRRYRIALLAENIPAFGYRAYCVEPVSRDKEPVFSSRVKIQNRVIENDFIMVEINKGGYFSLIDKATGEIYRNCNVLEDGGDVGDNYTYQAPTTDCLITNLVANDNFTVIEKGPIRATVRVDLDFALPVSISSDGQARSVEKVACPLAIYISLSAISRYVTICTEFNNQAKDHRLRVSFRPEIFAKQVYVDGHFDILARDIELQKQPGWLEKPSPTQPQRNFVTLRDKVRGLAILNKGLVQYEATNEQQPTFYITLLRCTGYLSKAGLEERNGHICGPGLPTPTAQCLGQHIFEYAVYPYDSSKISVSEIHQLGQEFNAPLKAIDINGKEGDLPEELSFCRVKGALASTYKKAENSDDVILRVYNISDHISQTEIEFFRPLLNVTEVTLSEMPVIHPLPLTVSNNKISLVIPAKRLVTFRVNLK